MTVVSSPGRVCVQVCLQPISTDCGILNLGFLLAILSCCLSRCYLSLVTFLWWEWNSASPCKYGYFEYWYIYRYKKHCFCPEYSLDFAFPSACDLGRLISCYAIRIEVSGHLQFLTTIKWIMRNIKHVCMNSWKHIYVYTYWWI